MKRILGLFLIFSLPLVSCNKQLEADTLQPFVVVKDTTGNVLESVTIGNNMSTVTVKVYSDKSWKASCDASWLVLGSTSGTKATSLQLACTQNETSSERSTDILFTAYSDTSVHCTLHVVQSSADKLSVGKHPRDLMLFYCGCPKYRDYYTEDKYLDYFISDNTSDPEWLFDGALFLEIYNSYYSDPSRRSFMGSSYAPFTTKEDNLALFDNWFNIQFKRVDAAMERAVAKVDSKRGYHKIKMVLMLPVLPYLKDGSSWGTVEELGTINWSKWNQVLEVYKWEVDQIVKKYVANSYKHLELSGIYWPVESAGLSMYNLSDIANHIKSWGLQFYFIPYFSTSFEYSIYAQWQKFGWDYCYLQPNYFFYDNVERSRLEKSCSYSKKYNMDYEMEFNPTSYKNITEGYTEEDGVRKMRDYLDVFDAEGVFENHNIAYYQGGQDYYSMKYSSREDYQILYKRLRDYIVKRQEEYYK